jgi:hypothetical protein
LYDGTLLQSQLLNSPIKPEWRRRKPRDQIKLADSRNPTITSVVLLHIVMNRLHPRIEIHLNRLLIPTVESDLHYRLFLPVVHRELRVDLGLLDCDGSATTAEGHGLPGESGVGWWWWRCVRLGGVV